MDYRTRSQRWADAVTEFSGSWPFIFWFIGICVVWIFANGVGLARWDPYPYLFLNWMLTVISTVQNPIILLSQNRQNETDRAKTAEILSEMAEIRKSIDALQTALQGRTGVLPSTLGQQEDI